LGGGEDAVPDPVCEAALAHVVKNKTEAAYFRSDLFEQRRALMDAWEQFVIRGTGLRDEMRIAIPRLRIATGKLTDSGGREVRRTRSRWVKASPDRTARH
jgi:hypothetical protein